MNFQRQKNQKIKNESFPLIKSLRTFHIKLTKDLNFFADFERFKKLSLPQRMRKKKFDFKPVNFHTAKLRDLEKSEVKRCLEGSFVKINQSVSGKSRVQSPKQVVFNFDLIDQKNRS